MNNVTKLALLIIMLTWVFMAVACTVNLNNGSGAIDKQHDSGVDVVTDTKVEDD